MKNTGRKKKVRSLDRPAIEKQMAVRLPKDFYFLLMEKLVYDLCEAPPPSGDFPILAHPDIDLLRVKAAIRSRQWDVLMRELSTFSIQSILEKWSDQPEKAFGLYQLHALFKKLPPEEGGNVTARAAYKTFLKYESHCATYNYHNWKAAVALNNAHPYYSGFLTEIRADIEKLLGSTPKIDCIYDCARHGPGTAVGHRSPAVTTFFKWSKWPYTVSPAAVPYAREAIERDPRWIGALQDSYRRVNEIPMWAPLCEATFWESVFQLTDYCNYGTVPKTAETDRSIGIEPTLNVYLQLGVDGVIRRKLKHRWGIDLNSQAKNQWLATKSSITNDDATIDLKGASDCVAMQAAYILLPVAWFDLLNDLRSKNIRVRESYTGGVGDETYPLHKLSAMGNGFTFVVETVIFTALARYAMRKLKMTGNLSVYGDDIILPRQAAPLLIDLLERFGFMVNEDKSFITGPFRESCGVDCLMGINIRPLFLKTRVSDVTHIWYIHNSLLELQDRLPEFWEVSFETTIGWLKQFIPSCFRKVVGPPGKSLDTYCFSRRTRYDRNGLQKHLALVPIAPHYNDRAPEWFFRKLMSNLLGSKFSAQERLEKFYIDRLLGIDCDIQSGWKTGGHVSEVAKKHDPSCFDVTLRDVVKWNLTTVKSWKV